jgi:hypothetical protein
VCAARGAYAQDIVRDTFEAFKDVITAQGEAIRVRSAKRRVRAQVAAWEGHARWATAMHPRRRGINLAAYGCWPFRRM